MSTLGHFLKADIVSVRGYFHKSEKNQNTFFYNVLIDNKYTSVKPLTTAVESAFGLLNNGDFVDLNGERSVGDVVVVDQINEVRIKNLYGRWKNKKTGEYYSFYQFSNTGFISTHSEKFQFQYTLTPSSTGESINMIFTVLGKDVKIFDFSLANNRMSLKLYDDQGVIVENHEFKKISK